VGGLARDVGQKSKMDEEREKEKEIREWNLLPSEI
jgi:hypothetical protein